MRACRPGMSALVATAYMEAAERFDGLAAKRCDRVALMDRGRVLACDAPVGIVKSKRAANLADAFIAYLKYRTERAALESPISAGNRATDPYPSPSGLEPLQQFRAEKPLVQLFVREFYEGVEISNDDDPSVAEPLRDFLQQREIDIVLAGAHE